MTFLIFVKFFEDNAEPLVEDKVRVQGAEVRFKSRGFVRMQHVANTQLNLGLVEMHRLVK